MRYTVKQAGGDEENNTNKNQNPPDATETMDKKPYLPGQRNPLKDAALGGGIGGLLGTALGYLYGHRGRWLAYDAIAGGAGGAGIGYMVGSSANKDIQNQQPEVNVNPNSKLGEQMHNKMLDIKWLERWKKARAEEEQLKREGGYSGFGGFFKDFRRSNARRAIGGHIKDQDEAFKFYKERRQNEDDAEKNPLWWSVRLIGKALGDTSTFE